MTSPSRPAFRLWPLSTVLLVLAALGTAGFAVAADRQPEADRKQAADALKVQLRGVEPMLAEIDGAARRVAGSLQAAQLEEVAAALADGDATVAELETVLPTITSQLDAVSAVPSGWRSMSAVAGSMGEVIGALRRHDEIVFAATGAARQSEWAAALELLGEARAPLAEAAAARAALSASGDVETLDDLLSRYQAYDASLVALYGHVRDTGSQDGALFTDLRVNVEQAQAALPRNDDVLAVIVGEVAAPAIADSLVAIQQARDVVKEALDT